MPINTEGGQTVVGDSFAFLGLVTDYSGPEVQPDKTVTWSFKAKVTGVVTPTLGS